jgi:hypothetical protein
MPFIALPIGRSLMEQQVTIQLGGRSYVWDGQEWSGADDHIIPPRSVILKLDDLLAERLAVEEATLTDWNELLQRAKFARGRQQYKRAERLARRARELNPGELGTVSVLCSVLREACRPQESLALADQFREWGYGPLLTSRAAALCDLDRWEEGLTQIKEVLAQGSNEAALAVFRRIKSYAPPAVRRKATLPRRRKK